MKQNRGDHKLRTVPLIMEREKKLDKVPFPSSLHSCPILHKESLGILIGIILFAFAA